MKLITTLSMGALISLNAHSIVSINLKVFLQGAYDPNTELMRDDLRTAGLIPTTEPYTALGFTQCGGGGGETTNTTVLSPSGPEAIVDWVLVALRSWNSPYNIIATQSALVTRSGNIVTADDASPGITFWTMPDAAYLVTVFHRNHFSVTTGTYMSSGTSFDFSVNTSMMWDPPGGGTAEVYIDTDRRGMWAGNVLHDNVIKYTGSANDREPILTTIGGLVPTNTAVGYLQADVNLDGVVKYTGSNNDRDVILVNIGGAVPTNFITEESP